MRLFNTLLLLSAGLLVSCQTPTKRFERIETGMTKYQVLEIAGNPTSSRRWKGKDRWTYELKDSKQTREVHFEGGKAVYIGDVVAPAISAEEQDRLNASGTKSWEAEIVRQSNAPLSPVRVIEPIDEDPKSESKPTRTPKYEDIQ